MKNKKNDILYNGCDWDTSIEPSPELDWKSVHYFKEWVIDRYNIHKRKDVKGLPAPYTKNKILRMYKFTNVRREHDKQTRYLIDNITNNPYLSLRDKILNCFLFRAWNNWDTLDFFDFPYTEKELCNPELKKRMRVQYSYYKDHFPRAFEKRKWWSNAFIQGGFKMVWGYADGTTKSLCGLSSTKKFHEPDIPLRPFHIGPYLNEHSIVDKILECKSQQEVFETIKTVPGYGDFLAYQVFVDLTYIKEFPFSENEFVVAGPGCKRGLDSIFKDKSNMTYEACIFWLRDEINSNDLFNCDALKHWEHRNKLLTPEYDPIRLFNDLPEYDRCMNVMSIENCMCELSKYIKAVNGTGRPRNYYNPNKEEKI